MSPIFRMLGLPVLALTLIFASLTVAQAAAPAPAGKPTQDKPAAVTARQTPISVMHEGSDSVGARLSTRLKEMYNSSNLFQLSDKEASRIRIQLVTQAEFTERPNVGSVYAVIWTFSQSDDHLGYLLAREIGTLSAEDVDNTAAKIVERTDGIAVKYRYLFQ